MTRALVARPDNNFVWSPWNDTGAALGEIDALLERVSLGSSADSNDLRRLFAPTGPLQELSLSSGWGEAYLKLAERMDEALRRS